MTWNKWWQGVWRQSPVMAVLIAIIASGAYGVWVWGTSYQEMRTDRDEYKEIALESVGLLERHVTPTNRSFPANTNMMPRPGYPTPKPMPRPTPEPDVKVQVTEIRKKLDML